VVNNEEVMADVVTVAGAWAAVEEEETLDSEEVLLVSGVALGFDVVAFVVDHPVLRSTCEYSSQPNRFKPR
jgi:hypothetical protein